MPDVLVDRLRMHPPPRAGPAPDPRASARALDLALPFPDRQILIVRRLAVVSRDRVAARTRLESLQRNAVRPGDGPVDPHAEAVVFADEAEALLCLTRDVVNGRADHWYWAGRLPTHAATAGEVLGRLWSDQPRWVPAVLSSLARSEPEVARRALGALPPGMGEVIARAAAREYDVSAPRPAPISVPRHGSLAESSSTAAAGEEHRLAGPGIRFTPAGLLPSAPPPEARPSSPRHIVDTGESGMVLPVAARQLLELAVRLVPGPTPSLLLAPSPAAANPVAAVVNAPPSSSSLRPPLQDETAESPAIGGLPCTAAVAASDCLAEQGDPPHPEPGEARREVVAVRTGQPADGRPAWSGSTSVMRSAVASAAYAIALMERTDAFPAAAARGESGWAAVEAAVRWLLTGLPVQRRLTALRDPLLRVLCELDQRCADSAPPAPPDRNTRRRMVARLDRHRVPRTAFARAGTVHVSRTHVDIVLPINAIDLEVRAAGLDQDPGWVPALGRIVLVHFEGGG